MREHFKQLCYFIFLLIWTVFVSSGLCQNKNARNDTNYNFHCIDEVSDLLKNRKLEKAIKELYQCSDKDSEAILIVLSEKNEKIEDLQIKISSISISSPEVDSAKSQMIRKINCKRTAAIKKIEFNFDDQSLKKVNPNTIQIALWPGHLVIVIIKEKELFNFYPEVSYYNLKRKSTSLLWVRISAVSCFGSLTWYGIRRLNIDEKNYENYLNAQSSVEADYLKKKCQDGQKITQVAGGLAIVSGAFFGYYFGKDILWPWISGNERLLAASTGSTHHSFKFGITPQFGWQSATIHLSCQF